MIRCWRPSWTFTYITTEEFMWLDYLCIHMISYVNGSIIGCTQALNMHTIRWVWNVRRVTRYQYLLKGELVLLFMCSVTMKVHEQNRLRVRLSQVYWGNHPLLRNGADTWRTPPYRTPLNRWTTKPAKPGHGQPCRGCYMVWTHRSLDMYRWHHPKHHSSPKYPFAHHPN